MQNNDYKSYFNSYAHKSPSRIQFVEETGYENPGYPEEWLEEWKNKGIFYEPVTAENYPKLHKALLEECRFRNIDIPACYIDHSKNTRLGRAVSTFYAFLVEPAAYEIMTQKELRALVAHEIKHLYQTHDDETPEQSCEHELDCDRAAVQSTDYKTILSYVRKAADIHLKREIAEGGPTTQMLKYRLGLLANKVFPRFTAEHYNKQLNEWHPPPAARMRAMREWEKQLKEDLPSLNNA